MLKAMLLTAILALCALTAVPVKAETFVLRTTPKASLQAAVPVSQLVAIQGVGILPTNGTVVVYTVIGGVTNTLGSATATDGAISATVSNAPYSVTMDELYIGGTSTNGVVRLFYQ